MDEPRHADSATPGPPLGPAAARASRLRRLRRRCSRGKPHAAAGVLLPVLVAAGFFVRLAALGLPESWVDALSDRLSGELYSVELSGVSFSLAAMELRVSEARVYPKGAVRKPLVRAAGARIGLRPRRSVLWTDWVRRLDVLSVSVSVPDEGLPASPDGDGSFPVAPFAPIPFSCRSSDVMGLHAYRTSGLVSCRDGLLRVDDVRTDLHGPRETWQRMEGSFECDPVRLAFRSRGKGRIDPSKLDALLRGAGVPLVADELAKYSFAGHPPEADVRYEYDPAAGVRSLDIGIRADAGGVCNGVAFSEGEARLRVWGPDGWTRLDVRDLRVRRPEGEERGEISFDLGARTIRFDVTSTIDPKHLLAMAEVMPSADILPFDFDNPTEIRASGFHAFGADEQARTDVRLHAESPGVSVPGLPGLRFDRVRADGVFTNGVFDLTSIRADALGGDADLSLRVALRAPGREEPELRAGGALRGVSHAAWASLFGEAPEGDEGRFDADFSLDGPLADIASMHPVRTAGSLDLRVRNVPVFHILFFSGLREFLSRTLSSFDPFAEDSLHVRAKMADGVIAVENLRIEGGALSITGDGNVWTDGVVNLGVKVHLMNRRTWVGAGIYYLFSPISSICAVRATGLVENPSWESEALFINGTDVKPSVAPPEGAGP